MPKNWVSGVSPQSARAWLDFRMEVTVQCGTMDEPEWLGADQPHRVTCMYGHQVMPRPNDVKKGHAICRVCSGKDPEAAWDAFRFRVTSQGGEVLEDAWKGNHAPHRVRCVSAHESTPTPASVQQGNGICRFCRVRHDVFYVVTGPDSVKFGVTSGDPAPRLARHASPSGGGHTAVERCWTGLPGDDAYQLERDLLQMLGAAGVKPVRGREYFALGVAPVVLTVADAFLGGRTLRTVPDAPESCGAVDAADLDACGLCPDCRRSQMKAVPEQRDEHVSPFGPVQRWGTLPQQAASQPSQDCPFLPGDAVPACDFDPNCPAHGILGKRP